MTAEGGPAPLEVERSGGVARLRERRREHEPYPLFAHAGWEGVAPDVVAGVTAATPGADFGLATAPSPMALFDRLDALGRQLGFVRQAVGRQVHGGRVTCLEGTPEPGLRVAGEGDGLVTRSAGLLLVVTAADCVPVYLLDPDRGALGLLHAGWRGVAAGLLRSGLRAMAMRFGTEPEQLRMHLGPAICGDCYEVGPEVLRALGREEAPSGRVDLRDELVRRARAEGVPRDGLSRSVWCTRCEADHFHSHRGKGDRAGRMAAYLGRTG